MSHIKILLDIVSDVRHLADSLETYANALAFSNIMDESEEISVPESNPIVLDEQTEPVKSYSLEDVRAVLAEISQSGRTSEVKALLQKYGAKQLSKVNPADYSALIKDAEVLKNA